mmetsp:Transcript_105987/g.203901  ORF Transcript_105987/g.203901 Transcript_105987/m.203901 type:complete len:920 (+) Transcript_105987:153-2912(+)
MLSETEEPGQSFGKSSTKFSEESSLGKALTEDMSAFEGDRSLIKSMTDASSLQGERSIAKSMTDDTAFVKSLQDGDTISKSMQGDGILSRPAIEEQAEEAEVAAYYLFQGNRYEQNEKAQFMEAAANNVQKSTSDHWNQLDDEAAMVALAHKLFQAYAGENKTLSLIEMTGLVHSVAAELGINPRELGHPSYMFYRHDFDGTGELDEADGVQMVASMLRYHRNLQAPDKPGQPKLLKLPVKRLKDHFELKKKLGKGGQGTVYLASEVTTGTQRVVKFFRKERVNCLLEDIKDEFRLLKELDHPKVQRLYDIFEDRCNVYLISEPYMGGDLQSLVPKARDAGIRVTNRWLGHILQQVLQGVAYLHQRHVMHCDLKEANAMICEAGSLENPSVVVIDFGLADKLVTKKMRKCGTPGYMPPEVWLNRLWTIKGDVFSLGVMIYQMFAGQICFPGIGAEAIQKRTTESKPDLEPLQRYGSLPSLISSMLNKDFKQRPTVRKVMEAPFFTCLQESAIEDLPDDVVNRLCHMGKKSEIEAAILVDIADMQNLAQLRHLNEAFVAMDTDHSGIITESEARSKLSESLAAEQVQGVLDALLGDDGQIPYTEFMGKMLMAGEADMEEVLWHEFQTLDVSGEGTLGEDEISKLLERPALAAAVASCKVLPADLMALMDKDSSGQISFEEFRMAFREDKKGTSDLAASPSHEKPRQISQKDKDSGHKATQTKQVEANRHSEPVIDVRWKRKNLVLYGTMGAMEEARFKGVIAHCACTLCCCWWLPLVFFLGAENASDDLCQVPLGLWLRIYGCVSIAVGALIHCFRLVCAKAGAKNCYKLGRTALLGWPVLLLLYSLSGIVIYAVVSDERCLRHGWSGVHPILLILIWALIFLGLFCVVVMLFGLLKSLPEDVNATSKVVPESDGNMGEA